MKTKCQEYIDKGVTCIRGFHNYSPCPHRAKYKVTYTNGRVEMLCGIHKRAALQKYRSGILSVETITND